MLSGPELELPKSRFAFDFEDCGFETILFVLCGVFTGSAWAQENKRRGEKIVSLVCYVIISKIVECGTVFVLKVK